MTALSTGTGISAARYQRWSSGTNAFTSASVNSFPWPSTVYPPKTKISPFAPTADAPKRPATPGTAWLSVHLPDLKRSWYILLLTSSHVFFVPIPMIEYTSSPPFRVATALLVTAIGMGGIFPSSDGKRETAHSTAISKIGFLIAEILRLYRGCPQSYFTSPWRIPWIKSVYAGVRPLSRMWLAIWPRW